MSELKESVWQLFGFDPLQPNSETELLGCRGALTS
jgi:hypothetical protein